MADSHRETKMSRVLRFLEKNQHLTQKELRDHFAKLGIKVSSSESSQAFKRAGLRRPATGMPEKGRKPRRPRSPVISVPVNESPVLYLRMEELRKQNNRLRRVIETLIDEEVDSALFASESN